MDPARSSSPRGPFKAIGKFFQGNVLRQALEFGSWSAISSVLLVALHVYSSRKLGPVSYGEVGVLLSIISALLIILSAVYLIINKFIAQYRSRAQEENIKFLIKLTFGDTILLGFAAFILCVVLSMVLKEFFHFQDSTTFMVFGLLVWVSFVDPVLEGVYKGLARFRFVGIFRVIESIARLVLVVIAIWLGWGVNGVIGAFAAGTLIGILCCLKPLWEFRNTNSHRIYLSEFYKYAIPVIVGSLGIALLLNLDVVLVKHFFTPLEAGTYAAASMLAKIAYIISASLGGVMFSNVARDYADGKPTRQHLRSTFITFSAIAVFILLVVYFEGSVIVHLIFGPAYDMGSFLFWFVLAFICFAFVNIFVLYDLARKKYAILWPLSLAVPAEAIALVIFHASIIEVVLVLLVFMGALLFVIVAPKKDELL